MHPPIHLAISWLIGHKLEEWRDRRLVAWAGVVADLDALSLLGGIGMYSQYHHVLTHGAVAAVAATVWIGLKRGRTFGETFLPARADAAVVETLRKILSSRRNKAGQQ